MTRYIICLVAMCGIANAQFFPPAGVSTASDARYFQKTGGTISGDTEIDGKLIVSDYVQDKPCRAYAYLTAPSNTTITTADNWYPVEGVFSNVVLDGFATTTVGGKPAIVYTNGYEGRFIIRIQAGVRAPASTTVGLTLKINDTVQSESGVPSYVFCRFDDQAYQVSNFGIPVITNGTTIQLMVSADDDDTVLTFDQFKVKTERWR
ncbi:hypothetical protein EOL73_00075 [Candidatus Saccharibacteria bacterium]|nr:hypothetical protein [Candidatus Saccharibacteria bacterium]